MLLPLRFLVVSALLVVSPGISAQPRAAQSLLALTDRVVGEVAAMRGLRVRRRVERGVLDRDALVAKIRARIREEYTAEEIRGEGLLFGRLGLVPIGSRYDELVFGLLEEQVAGYYDTTEHRLFLASWLEPEMQVPTLAHEIAHALQDQSFGLGEKIRALRSDADRRAALSALAEGDGMAVMIDYLARGTGRDLTSMDDPAAVLREEAARSGGQPVFERTPRVLREMLLFPYLAGVTFVRTLRVRGGWRAVDDAFRNPPDSSEQVLHPERFFARDPPIAVDVPPIPALAATHDEVFRDALGEIGIRLALEERLPREVAGAAATGWGGDRVVVWLRRGAPAAPALSDVALVLHTAWDTERDASEAAAAFADAMARRFPRARGRGRARCLDDGTVVLVERRDREVVYLEGIPSPATAAVRRQAWGHAPYR